VLATTIPTKDTNKGNKTWTPLQNTGCKNEPYSQIITDIIKRNSERKDTYDDNTKTKNMSNTDPPPPNKPGMNAGAREV